MLTHLKKFRFLLVLLVCDTCIAQPGPVLVACTYCPLHPPPSLTLTPFPWTIFVKHLNGQILSYGYLHSLRCDKRLCSPIYVLDDCNVRILRSKPPDQVVHFGASALHRKEKLATRCSSTHGFQPTLLPVSESASSSVYPTAVRYGGQVSWSSYPSSLHILQGKFTDESFLNLSLKAEISHTRCLCLCLSSATIQYSCALHSTFTSESKTTSIWEIHR